MSSKSITSKIFIPGGIMSPGDLKIIASTAAENGIGCIHFGERQEIYLRFQEQVFKPITEKLKNTQYYFQVEPFSFYNIISSYPVKNLDNSVKWLTEGIYREIIGSFSYQPILKINIVDPLQGMVPLFSGHLNFVASKYENYWYLYLRLYQDVKRMRWPVLVDSTEISSIALQIEKLWLENPLITYKELEQIIYNSREWTFRVSDEKPDLSPKRFFYYEGLHPMDEKRYWLGIYERLNNYPVRFLEFLSDLCDRTDIGSITITPYKSLIIKNIAEKDVPAWMELLAEFRINTCHSSLEVNFTIPDLDTEAMELRKFIFNYFDNREVRSDGLIFSLHGTSESTGNIIVEKNKAINIAGIELLGSYNIRYRKEFNPNSQELITFSDGVKKRDVPEILMYLCGKYYEILSQKKNKLLQEVKEIESESKQLFQCSNCLTVYDEEYGDTFNNVPPGLSFSLLPSNYRCPVCNCTKDYFQPFSTTNPIV
jgi:rubredoxin